jgi:hypothetical protein
VPASPGDLAADRLVEPAWPEAAGATEVAAVRSRITMRAAVHVWDRIGCRAVSSAAGHTHSCRSRIC